MRITYLVFWNILKIIKEGVKRIYEQTNGLMERGHDVRIVALREGEPQEQYPFKAEIMNVERFGGMIPVSDIIIACFGGSALPACQVIKELPFYLIQCIEGNLTNHLRYKEICEASYRLPLNLICISRDLKDLIEKGFYRKVHLIPDETDSDWLENLFDKALKIHSQRQPQDWHPWEKVLMLSPDDPWAHYQYGIDLQRMGNLEGAKKEFKKTIELKPDFILAYKELGRLLIELGDHKEAITYLKMAKRRFQQCPHWTKGE